MLPIDYQTHCAECHGLQFDQRFSEPAPHKKPEIVVDYVTDKFTKYIAAHPGEVHLAEPADPRILRPPLPPARDAAEWISRRVADSETLLWRKSCKECHTLTMVDGALPEVPPAAIPKRWFNHAAFDHEAHQMVGCSECHKNARASSRGDVGCADPRNRHLPELSSFRRERRRSGLLRMPHLSRLEQAEAYRRQIYHQKFFAGLGGRSVTV